jgi:hypothetical protein
MKIKDLVRPDFPDVDMAFWNGFASIFDFRGRLRSKTLGFSPESDSKAIERDWKIVGDDMRRAIERFQAR